MGSPVGAFNLPSRQVRASLVDGKPAVAQLAILAVSDGCLATHHRLARCTRVTSTVVMSAARRAAILYTSKRIAEPPFTTAFDLYPTSDVSTGSSESISTAPAPVF